jgi:hypothetical protein
MLRKFSGIVALVGMFALSLLLLNCGSSRPSGLLYVVTQGISNQGLTGIGYDISSYAIDLDNGYLSLVNDTTPTCPTSASTSNPYPCGASLQIMLDPTAANAFVLNQGVPCAYQPGGTLCQPEAAGTIPPSIYTYTVTSSGNLSPGSALTNWTCYGPGTISCTASNSYPDTAINMQRDSANTFLFVINEGQYPQLTVCPAIARPIESLQDLPGYANSQPIVGCPSISVFSISGDTLTYVSQSTTYQSPLFLSKVPSAISPIIFTPPGSQTSEEVLFVSNNYDLCTIGCSPLQKNPSDNTVSVYTVSSTGVLTEQPNSPYSINAPDPISVMAVNTTPSGQSNAGGIFVFVGNQGSTVGAVNPFQLCTIQSSSCTATDVTANLLVPVNCSPSSSCSPSAGENPIQMVVDPTNNFLYVMSEFSNQVFAFRINTTTGTLAALAPADEPTGTQPVSMALHPTVNNTGQFLFVSNSGSDNLTGFSLDTITGALSTSPITVIAPASPTGLAVH